MLSRRPRVRPWREVAWDGATIGGWANELDGCDVVINLAGRSVNCRYSAANRRGDARVSGIVDPRRRRGDRGGEASTACLASSEHRDDLLTPLRCAERRGVGHASVVTSRTRRAAGDSASTWRAHGSARSTRRSTPRTRKVALRSAMTMSPDRRRHLRHAARPRAARARWAAGDGRQFISWIHHADFVRAVRWLIEHDELDGVVNVCSPNPLPNREFMRLLREAAGVRSVFRRRGGCWSSARCSCAPRPS